MKNSTTDTTTSTANRMIDTRKNGDRPVRNRRRWRHILPKVLRRGKDNGNVNCGPDIHNR